MAIQPAQPIPAPRSNRCAACGGPLIGRYYTLLDRNARYCETCITTRPRCDNCGAPLGPDYWRLHDGRLQCSYCHSTAVYDPAIARGIFEETVTGLVAQLDLRLNVGAEFRLVDAPALNTLRSEESAPPLHPSGEPIRLLGLYQRQGRQRVIYMLYGLPRLLFRTTVAHEYAHVWQGENCPLLTSELLREGFAEWVAYHHLNWLGCTRAAQRMLEAQHPYRPGLDLVLDLERQLGMRGVIDYIKRAE